MVVLLQTLRPAECRLELADRPGLGGGDKALDVLVGERLTAQPRQLVEHDPLDIVDLGLAAQRDRDLEHPRERPVLLAHPHGLRDRVVVDQRAVQPARPLARQRVGQHLELGVAVAVHRRRVPGEHHLAELGQRIVGDHNLGGLHHRHRHRHHPGLRAHRQRAEPLADQLLAGGELEVARYRQGRVGRHVPGPEEPLDVVERGRLQVLVLADRRVAIGMPLGIQRRGLGEQRLAVRHVVDALAALVAHDIDLVVEAALVDQVEQPAHAVALEPQRRLELVRRHHFKVVGAIGVGRAVDVLGPDVPQDLEVLVLADVLRALEHHVLEQVREAALARHLVARADVVPDVDRDQRHGRIRRQDHLEAVRQPVALECHPGIAGVLRRRHGDLVRHGDGRGNAQGDRRRDRCEDRYEQPRVVRELHGSSGRLAGNVVATAIAEQAPHRGTAPGRRLRAARRPSRRSARAARGGR